MVATLENKKILPAQLEGEFQTLLSTAFSSEPLWLIEKRKDAFGKFSETGIPDRKNEEYKYTDLKKIFAGQFSSVHNEPSGLKLDIGKLSVDNDAVKLVFVNGWLYKDSTLRSSFPAGVIIGNLATDLFSNKDLVKMYLSDSGDAPAQMNAALWTDGALIYIPAGTRLQSTIEIINIYTGTNELLVSPRHLIVADKNAEVSIIEQNISIDATKIVANAVTDVFVSENSKVQLYRVQNECRNVSQISYTTVVQSENSHFDTNTLTLGSEWTRNNLNIALNGKNCESHLNGLFITGGTDHIDNHTSVQHNEPNCQSNQLYKGILDGRSTGVFNGKIYVKRDAQKTNAYQSSKNILLSDDATINTKPQLEIYADDVKCSHGSTTGQLNEEALFYLRSRGLSVDSARNLLLYAFANDVLNTIKTESLKNYLETQIKNKLDK